MSEMMKEQIKREQTPLVLLVGAAQILFNSPFSVFSKFSVIKSFMTYTVFFEKLGCGERMCRHFQTYMRGSWYQSSKLQRFCSATLFSDPGSRIQLLNQHCNLFFL